MQFERAQSNVDIRRSRFNNKFHHLTTMNAGFLYPIESFDVLPGSTFEIEVSQFIRQSTPIHPVMDDAMVDIFCFYVPNRQIFDKTKQFFGEPNDDPYAPTSELLEPVTRRETYENEIAGIQENFGSISRRSLAAYYGAPIGSRPLYLNSKYARGYGKIWNRWFRAEELQQAIDVPTDDIDRLINFNVDELPDVQSDPDYYINCAKDYGYVAPVCKFHDYFTSCLRNPQRGDPASIPLNGVAPVYAMDGVQNVVKQVGNQIYTDTARNTTVKLATNGNLSPSGTLRTAYGGQLRFDPVSGDSGTTIFLNNLVADLGYSEDLSKSVGLAYSTITDLRYAFATQRYLEANNRFGTRYKEYLKAHFSVDANNIELQDPELLGHIRTHVGMTQVVQNSATDDVSPQGNMAAYSLTSDKSFLCRKSFTEFGVIHVLACIRPFHTYQQGLAKKFSKRRKLDYYHPEFANISELPVFTKEIYVDASIDFDNDRVFGFQEAWQEYRQFNNRISGMFHSASGDSFDIWHYGDYYDSAPTLSAGWIAETYKNVDRTLTVMSDVADQFKCDFAFNVTHVEPMPVYSIPGLGSFL